MDQISVAVVGHSFVVRLNDFILADRDTDLNFGLRKVDVQFLGTSGLTIDRLREVQEDLVELQPKVIVLLLGENDIKQDGVPEELALKLAAAVTMISTWAGGAQVICCELMPRYYESDYKYFVQGYNDFAEEVNGHLKIELLSSQNCAFWRHNFAVRKVYFADDGVHLNNPGTFRLYKSIRHCIIMNGLK